MANDTLRKVRSYLRQIEKMAEQGNLEGIKRDAGLAMRLRNDGPTMKSAEGADNGARRSGRRAFPRRYGQPETLFLNLRPKPRP